MKKKQIKIFSILLVFIFVSCGVNESDESYYDSSINENGVTFLIKNGSISSPGKMKIINNTNQSVFVPFIKYPYCYFSNYTMEQKIDSNWKSLFINEDGTKWIKNIKQDSILVICEEYKNPIEIKPSHTYEINLSPVESDGEYRVNIYIRYFQIMNQDFPDKKMSLNYFVNE